MLTGIDISKWQGSINWDAFKLDFVIIKATEGVGFTDPKFSENNSEVVKRGIPHGFYHYVYGSGNTPEAEANYFLDTLGQLDPGEVLAIDFEEPDKVGDPVDYVRRMAQVIIDRVGIKPLIYLNSSLCRSYNWQPLVDMNCGLWIANYGVNNGQPNGDPLIAYWPFYAMWQYSSTAQVQGVAGNVDINQFFGDVRQFKAYGYKGVESTTTTTTMPESTTTTTTELPTTTTTTTLEEPTTTTTTTTEVPSTTTTTTTLASTGSLYDWLVSVWNMISNFLKQYKKG